MDIYSIEIIWDGPYSWKEVIDKKNDAGKKPAWEGDDYGLYQIYGTHILSGKDTLLYVGKATQQTFSARFRQHREWLEKEKNIKIYLGRSYDPKKNSGCDHWKSWENDIEMAEKILIYKYTPNYNSSEIGDIPRLSRKFVRLVHRGKKHNIYTEDNHPRDYK